MRSFFQVKSLLILLAGILVFDSCTVDDDPTDFTTPPFISLVSDATLVSTDDTVPAGAMFFVRVEGTKGTNDINSLAVQRDGFNIDLSELTVDGVASAGNPKLLFDLDRASFSFDIGIMPHATGDALYSFVATGDGGTEDVINITISIDDIDPTISITGSGAYITDVGSSTGVTLSADGMGTDISTIGFYVEGVLMAIEDVSFQGSNITENPINLAAGQTSFTDAAVIIRQGNELGTKNYTIVVTTASGKTAEAAYTIEVQAVGTAFDAEFTGVLLENAAGQDPTGGINLYDGETVSVNASNAHIIDSGNSGGSWTQTIEGNTTTSTNLRALSQGQIDLDLSYASIVTKEQLADEFNQADALSFNVSSVVSIGDVFFAQVDNDYFLMLCTEVGVNMAGLGFYNFDIKKAEF